jgi:hypothetical protein
MKSFSTRVPGILLIAFVTIAGSAQWLPSQVPAYNPAPPKKTEKLAPILAGEQLSGPNFRFGYQVQAYRLAAKIPNVIYQQPCFCFCDRSVGHKSLRSCFESEHGAHCSTCMKEVYYSYKMTKGGKTPQQISAGIEKGEWDKIDLEQAATIN